MAGHCQCGREYLMSDVELIHYSYYVISFNFIRQWISLGQYSEVVHETCVYSLFGLNCDRTTESNSYIMSNLIQNDFTECFSINKTWKYSILLKVSVVNWEELSLFSKDTVSVLGPFGKSRVQFLVCEEGGESSSFVLLSRVKVSKISRLPIFFSLTCKICQRMSVFHWGRGGILPPLRSATESAYLVIS